MSAYLPPDWDSSISLIERQVAFERVFLTFPVRDYIRLMSYCSCIGVGCPFCSFRGWRHTPLSMAFGQGLNALPPVNPYSFVTHRGLYDAYKAGEAAR